MKQKLLLLVFSLLGFAWANAKKGPVDGIIVGETGKKDDVNGTVIHSESKKPLKDVTITAYLVSKKEKISATNDLGEFSFDELKPGTYKFIFEKAGFRKVTKEKVVIKIDEAFQMNIEMIEAGEYDIMPSPFNIGGGL
jgi:hypothetical protein